MPAPLDPAKRDAIAQAVREGQTRNAIAREHNVSGSTVSKIAKEIETQTGEPPFEQSQTKRARERRADDLAARRVELAGLLMDDAFRMRDRMWEDQTEVVGSMEGPRMVVRPTNAGEFRNYLTAIGIAVDKVGVLTRDDGDAERKASSLIQNLVAGLREAAA